MLTEHDARAARCPKLGHNVSFTYCRQPGSEVPCAKIFDCWWETFDVQDFVAANYSPEIQAAIIEPPKPKMLSLIEIIEQARQRGANCS